VEDECNTRYKDNISLNIFKYRINSGASASSINLQDKINNLNILSLYTTDIFIDSDFLKILSTSIDEDLQ
jgi:hypothetical protein